MSVEPGVGVVTGADRVALQRMARLSWMLDSSIRLPVIGYRVGLDSIIGLVPGVGDLASAMIGTWIVIEAVRLGVPRATLLRMAGNVGLDLLAGGVPVAGDLFDAVYKSNRRNVRLMEEHLADPGRARRVSSRYVTIAAVLAGLALVGAAVVLYLLVSAALSALSRTF